MKEALEGRPVVDFPVPEDVVFAQIDRATGLRANPGSDAELEVFRRGSEPTTYAAVPEPEVDEYGAPVDGDPDAMPQAEEAAHEIPSEALRPIEEQDLSGTD
jgi:membrane carboxypeptidase/penicillin-binding protein